MNYFQKIMSVAVVATFSVSAVASPASAHNPQNYKGTGILPVLGGPVGAAALFPATNTFNWTTTKFIPWSKTFTWTKTIYVNQNAYFIQNAVGQGNQPWVQVTQQAYNNTPANIFNKKIDIVSTPKEITKTKTIHGKKKVTKSHSRSSKTVGKAVVGCIFGSALGAITAAVRKGNAMGNPLRWRSQAEHERILASGVEKKYELTNEEAHTAVALCGLGSLTLHWPNAGR
jgi:hypothetical protein